MKTKEQIGEMVIKIQAEVDGILKINKLGDEHMKRGNKLLGIIEALHWVRFETKLEINK